MEIPIIILNWNGIEDTLECMESIFAQTYTDYVVYLLDNGSEGNDTAILTEKYGAHPKVELILESKNHGFTLGNNLILEEYILPNPDYEYVVLLNNDTTVPEDWLENLLGSAQTHHADMVACKMVNYYNRKRMDNAGHKMLNTAEVIPLGYAESVEAWNTPHENMGACAGAALYAVPMLCDIGIFDEYFNTGYEDAELGMRANILGYKSIYAPSAIVYHKESQSVSKIMNYEYLLKIQLNIFYSYFKLMPAFSLWLNLPSLLFKYLSILIIDVIFIRPKFLKIMLHAMYRTLFTERKTILNARHNFQRKHRPISALKLQRKMEFFLWFDIKRFVKYVILRRKTEFERY